MVLAAAGVGPAGDLVGGRVEVEIDAAPWRWNDEETIVRWKLEGSGGRTRLTLVHCGFGKDDSAKGYRLGWQAFLVASGGTSSSATGGGGRSSRMP